MSNLKLLKHGFYRSVSYTIEKGLSRKNRSELLKKHQINFSCSTTSTILLGYSIAVGLACFSDV